MCVERGENVYAAPEGAGVVVKGVQMEWVERVCIKGVCDKVCIKGVERERESNKGVEREGE